MSAARPNPRFFMTLVTDPLTDRLTFAVPLGRLPKGMRITKPKKHHYLVCDCGGRKRFTLMGLGQKGRKPTTLRGLRRVVAIDVKTWVEKHGCSVRGGRAA